MEPPPRLDVNPRNPLYRFFLCTGHTFRIVLSLEFPVWHFFLFNQTLPFSLSSQRDLILASSTAPVFKHGRLYATSSSKLVMSQDVYIRDI